MLPAESESESVAEGKTRQLRDGRWSVQCKWCEERKPSKLRTILHSTKMPKTCNWRLSNPRKKYIYRNNWSCPDCAQFFKDSDATPTATDTTPTATDAAGSAGQLAAHAAAPSSDALRSEVEQLKAEVETLKAEVLQWRELLRGHMQMKEAHVNELRLLKKEIADLRAEFTAAQHPPPVSPPGIE